MVSSSKVREMFANPLVTSTAFVAIREIDSAAVRSPSLEEANLKAAELLVLDWMHDWGEDADALSKFQDLLSVSSRDLRRAKSDLMCALPDGEQEDAFYPQLAVQLVRNWLSDATKKNGSCLIEFVILTYMLSMTTVAAPMWRRQLLRGFRKQRSWWSVAFVATAVSLGLAFLNGAMLFVMLGILMMIPLITGLQQSMYLVTAAEREWN